MYTITANEQFKSWEVSFDGKPSEEVRDALKALRYRWHSVKRVWYGYGEREALEKALASTSTQEAEKPEKAPELNAYGVKVGDIFSASWGYEQTNNNFFQVIALVGKSSVRVREVWLPVVAVTDIGPMAEDRECRLPAPGEILPPSDYSVFIKDQEKGDLKRLKSYAADKVSNPEFNLSSFANAHYCGTEGTVKVYESSYA